MLSLSFEWLMYYLHDQFIFFSLDFFLISPNKLYNSENVIYFSKKKNKKNNHLRVVSQITRTLCVHSGTISFLAARFSTQTEAGKTQREIKNERDSGQWRMKSMYEAIRSNVK